MSKWSYRLSSSHTDRDTMIHRPRRIGLHNSWLYPRWRNISLNWPFVEKKWEHRWMVFALNFLTSNRSRILPSRNQRPLPISKNWSILRTMMFYKWPVLNSFENCKRKTQVTFVPIQFHWLGVLTAACGLGRSLGRYTRIHRRSFGRRDCVDWGGNERQSDRWHHPSTILRRWQWSWSQCLGTGQFGCLREVFVEQ